MVDAVATERLLSEVRAARAGARAVLDAARRAGGVPIDIDATLIETLRRVPFDLRLMAHQPLRAASR